MGLYVHSLGEIPINVLRGYYVYLLDYGWDETFGEAVRRNLPKMADLASRSNAVVVHGPRGVHFEDEVLSWHHVNGRPAEEILPALLITTRHPATFRETFGPTKGGTHPSDAMLLIPLKEYCKTPDEVVALVARVFADIQERKALSDFQIAAQMRRGIGQALVNALVLRPSVSGIGVDLKELTRLFRK